MKLLQTGFFLFVFVLGLSQAADLSLVLTVPVETRLDHKLAPDTQQTWLEMIQSAKDTIDIEQFYVSSKTSEPMEAVLDAVKAAAKHNVAVRLLVDKQFLKNESGGTTLLAGMPNIEIRTIDYTKLEGGVQHAKFFVVDGQDAYLGSANFDWRALKHVHEAGIRTQDAHVVTSLQSVFERDWTRGVRSGSEQVAATATRATIAKEAAVAFSASPVKDLPKGVEPTLTSLLSLIATAKTSVQMQTMEYSNAVFGKKAHWLKLQKALIAAAKHATVQLMIDASKASQPGLTELKKAGIEVKGVTIPEHSSGPIPFARLIHSKYVVVDGTHFWLGTDNMGEGYFEHSRGVAVLSSDSTVSHQLAQVFNELWTSSYAHSL